MPIPSPFHERTAASCESYRWKDWAGYCAVCRYGVNHEYEYHAIRQAAGLIDVSPLFKYEIKGRDSLRLLNRMMVRDLSRLGVGRVAYTCWCDDAGKVIDDGTVSRLDESYYRLTAAEPSFAWLSHLSRGLEVTISDSSERLAALAIQGPSSREILQQVCDLDLSRLGYFRVAPARIGDRIEGWISRTGYTGDLGYEIWIEAGQAIPVWDLVVESGHAYGCLPAGLDALDMTRIEAGYIMLDVDYHSSQKEVRDSRKSTPYELGLGWMVRLEREPFVGQESLRRERQKGAEWTLVGLELSWPELEALYDSYGLPAALPAEASRTSTPVYQGDRQLGQATSNTWSPILKKSIALASLQTPVHPGSSVQIEHTVEHQRRRVSARIVELPFFDPERKRKP